MAETIAVIGNPGTGKSTSIRNLDPTQTFIINVAGKPLPIRGFKKNYTPFSVTKESGSVGNLANTSDADTVVKLLKHISDKRSDIKTIVVDDSGYIMGFSNMDKVDETGFKKFVQMAKEFYNVIKTAGTLRDDLKIFFFGHEENIGDALNPQRKFKTVGKLLDNAITVEGLFTYVFFTQVERNEENGGVSYHFATNTDGTTTAKTPMGCFDSFLIDNDLAYIIEKIDEYNEG